MHKNNGQMWKIDTDKTSAIEVTKNKVTSNESRETKWTEAMQKRT